MPNRLAQTQSLYLRKHAENPIDWWSWGEEALEAARRQNKPIFLSIGYSSCHWCTVMEGEAFSDPDIAKYLNANFLPIKVDREERPDIDSIYMQALQMMTGQGGWPLNIFLAPDDLVPFYGGTYFPVEQRYNRPAFLHVLQSLKRFYDQDKTKLEGVKEEILAGLRSSVLLDPSSDIGKDVLFNGLAYSGGIIAGKAPGPSFPMIPYSDATLRGHRFTLESKYDAAETALQRGLDLALGGIFDHVAGGFHRYTVDPTWTVPHFEKMLYDNGQIMEFLANLWSLGHQSPAFVRAIVRTVQWLKREMTAPAGYFYAAQDADSFINADDNEPEEGAFYVWHYEELAAKLTPIELTELENNFTITVNGNFEETNVLQRTNSLDLSPLIEAALERLFVVRYGKTMAQTPTFPPAENNQTAQTNHWPGRIPAVTDTKMIVAWNALMISGLAKATIAFTEPEYYQLAKTAAEFIWQNQRIKHRLYRLHYHGEVSGLAQSEDYALLIKAMIDLHQAALVMGADAQLWQERAIALQSEFDRHLWSLEMYGYYNTADDASRDLLLRERSYIDNATPSANGVAVTNLVRLMLLTDDLSYIDRAETILQAFGSVMKSSPQACPSLFAGLDWFHHATLIQTQPEQIQTLAKRYLPTTIFRVAATLPEGAIALVCRGLRCDAPAESIAQLNAQIAAINRN
jgi:uncharacterized protein